MHDNVCDDVEGYMAGKSKIDKAAIGRTVVRNTVNGIQSGKLHKGSSALDVAECFVPDTPVTAVSVAAAVGGALLSKNKVKGLAKAGATLGAAYMVQKKRKAAIEEEQRRMNAACAVVDEVEASESVDSSAGTAQASDSAEIDEHARLLDDERARLALERARLEQEKRELLELRLAEAERRAAQAEQMLGQAAMNPGNGAAADLTDSQVGRPERDEIAISKTVVVDTPNGEEKYSESSVGIQDRESASMASIGEELKNSFVNAGREVKEMYRETALDMKDSLMEMLPFGRRKRKH